MLFVERAAAAAGSFELTNSNRAAVAGVCRRLDGLPLAIELAAVRMRVLSVEQILDRLRDRFALLTRGSRAALPRHQTLRTTIEWSHELLTADERALLRRLCVLAGRFTLEDVESVCTSDEVPAARALDLLSSLVDKSLVMKEDAKGVACYRLHETMREYAVLKLHEAGEENTFELRCTDYYVARCQRSAADARYRLVEWLEWMDLEIDNIRAVLQRCLIHADSRGIALATSLGWYWITRATSEGARWLDALLASYGANHNLLAPAYFMRGMLAVLQADPTTARPALQHAAEAAREAGDPLREPRGSLREPQQLRLLSESLAMASTAEKIAGDHSSARRILDEAELVTTRLDDYRATVAVLQARAINGLFEGDLDAVRSASSEGVRRGREAGDLYTPQVMLINLGAAALIAGDLDDARTRYTEALRIAQQIDDRVAQFYLVGGLACRAAGSREPRLAAQLLGAARTLRAEIGMSVNAILGHLVVQAMQAATAALGQSKYDTEFETGARYHRSDAVRLALGESAPGGVESASQDGWTGLLGEREADVARLVADGLTNKQIGAQLLISERTVESHVRNIMNKLGFNSRAQIASWMAHR